jgi:hypothetical protein
MKTPLLFNIQATPAGKLTWIKGLRETAYFAFAPSG